MTEIDKKLTEKYLMVLANKIGYAGKPGSRGWKTFLQKKLGQSNPSTISTWITRGVPRDFETQLINADINPKNWQEIINGTEKNANYETEDDLKDVVSDVIKIMQSGNAGIIKALVKNVQEFSLAVDTARELTTCLESIEGMQKQIDDLNKKVDKLTAHPDGVEHQDAGSEKKAM
jgi:hypothetical protein